MTPAEARAQYPVLERLAYLNAGTFGPLARATAEAVAERRVDDLENGRGGPRYFGFLTEARQRVREAIAATIHVEPGKVALTRSTTDGCNIVLAALGLGPEDEVVTTDAEHFGLLGPLRASGARVRVARVSGRPAAEAFDVIRAEVGPRTRLLALSHVLWTTGHRLPIAELRAETRLPMLVDGAQAVGAIPVDATEFDYYTVSCQKWLCCPDATGALYVRDPDALPVAFPSYFCQVGYEEDGAFEPQPGAARFDNSWLEPGLLAGIEAALAAHPEWAHERARELAADTRELLAERFDVVTEPEHATLVSFRARVETPTAELALRAYEHGVVIRDLPGTGLLRVSCGYWNTLEDVERLVAALVA